MSRALETAGTMTKKELFAKAEELTEYGMDREPVTCRWNRVIEERAFRGNPVHAVAALNNGDTDHALLALLKKEPDKVFEGLEIAAMAVDADAKLLYIPDGEEELAERLRNMADRYGTEIRTGIVDVRYSRGGIYHHFETLIALTEVMEGTYIPATYMAVRRNGQTGDIIRVEYGSDIDSVLKKAGVGSLDGIRAIALGNTLYLPDTARGIVISPDTPIGNGVISLYPGSCCMVHEADENLAAYIKISCGKCTFCREGLIQLKSNTEDIISGNASKGCVALMEEIGEAMTFSSQCTLGRAAPEFMLGTLKLFGSEYDEHIRKKKCAKNVCYSLSTIYIDPNECRGCEECLDICPAEAIEGKKGFIHMIDEYECIKCGKCIEACEYKAIILTNGRVPKLPERLTKVGKFRKH